MKNHIIISALVFAASILPAQHGAVASLRSPDSLVQDTVLCYQWDSLSGTWKINTSEIHVYDAKGNQTSWIYQTWNGTNQVDGYRYDYTYDANGNQTSKVTQNWDGTNWVNYDRYDYTYDASGNQTSR